MTHKSDKRQESNTFLKFTLIDRTHHAATLGKASVANVSNVRIQQKLFVPLGFK